MPTDSMTTLTIEIPDNITEDVLKYLKDKDVVIRDVPFKSIDDLTEEDYTRNFVERAKKMRTVGSKYIG